MRKYYYPVIYRLANYLCYLAICCNPDDMISGAELSARLHYPLTTVRMDLYNLHSDTPLYTHRRVGDVIAQLQTLLGFHQNRQLILIGEDPLTDALLHQLHPVLEAFRVAAVFSDEDAPYNPLWDKTPQYPTGELDNYLSRNGADIAIISGTYGAVPSLSPILRRHRIPAVLNLGDYPIYVDNATMSQASPLANDVALLKMHLAQYQEPEG